MELPDSGSLLQNARRNRFVPTSAEAGQDRSRSTNELSDVNPKNKRFWRLVVVVAVISVIFAGGLALANLRATRMTIVEFKEFVEGPSARRASLWKGIDYCGQEDGWAYF